MDFNSSFNWDSILTRKLSSFTSVFTMNTRQFYFCYFKLLFLCLLIIFFVLLLLLLLLLSGNEFSLFVWWIWTLYPFFYPWNIIFKCKKWPYFMSKKETFINNSLWKRRNLINFEFSPIIPRSHLKKKKNLLEWLLSKRQEITSVGENVEKRESLWSVGGDVNWIGATVENSMEIPQKIKTRTTIWSSNPASEY